MILMQGSNRLLENSEVETSTSATTRIVSMYGITSYNQLLNKVITIVSGANGTNSATTLNINSLGAKSIRQLSNGSLVDPESNWVLSGMPYQVTYNGSVFVLLNRKSSGGTQTESPFFAIPAAVTNLTNSSTEAQIKTVLGGDSGLTNFMLAVESGYTLKFSDSSEHINYMVEDYYITENSLVLRYYSSDNFKMNTLDFTINGSRLISVSKSDNLILNLAKLPNAVENLTNSSTSQEIITAFGSVDFIEKLRADIISGASVYLNHKVSVEATADENTISFSFMHIDGTSPSSIKYIIDVVNDDYSIEIDESTYINAKTATSMYMYDSNLCEDTALYNCMEQIRQWRFEGSPTDTQLTAFMQAGAKDIIENLISNGTIIKFQNIEVSGQGVTNEYRYLSKYLDNETPSNYAFIFNPFIEMEIFAFKWDNSTSTWSWYSY